jgi:hypothetical protein
MNMFHAFSALCVLKYSAVPKFTKTASFHFRYGKNASKEKVTYLFRELSSVDLILK